MTAVATRKQQSMTKSRNKFCSTQKMDMLRAKLQEITDIGDVSKHPAMIEALQEEIPHTIKILNGPNDYLKYNCFMYALGLAADEEFEDLVEPLDLHIHPNKKFMRFLLENEYLDEQEDATAGSLVVYFGAKGCFEVRNPEHAGRLHSETRVDSKWGIGLLYEHGIWEVPTEHGKVVRYFSPLERDRSVECFKEFAEKIEGVDFANSG